MDGKLFVVYLMVGFAFATIVGYNVFRDTKDKRALDIIPFLVFMFFYPIIIGIAIYNTITKKG